MHGHTFDHRLANRFIKRFSTNRFTVINRFIAIIMAKCGAVQLHHLQFLHHQPLHHHEPPAVCRA